MPARRDASFCIYTLPPSFGRKGLGRALMKIAQERAPDRGLRTMTLHMTVTNWQVLEFDEDGVRMNNSLQDREFL